MRLPRPSAPRAGSSPRRLTFLLFGSIIPIVVQLKKSDAAGGRGVSEIYFADEVDEHGQRVHGRRD